MRFQSREIEASGVRPEEGRGSEGRTEDLDPCRKADELFQCFGGVSLREEGSALSRVQAILRKGGILKRSILPSGHC